MWQEPSSPIDTKGFLPMYASTFPASPATDAYLRSGRIIEPDETSQDMVNRVVTALATADACFGPQGAQVFAKRLGWALDTGRIVFSTPIMTNAGRYPDRPLAACAVPPVDLRGDLAAVKTVVDDYHRAGMGTGFNLDASCPSRTRPSRSSSAAR